MGKASIPSPIIQLYEPADATTAVVDIVFVHGLAEGPESTWTHHESKTFWPKDLLPHTCPRTRILSFEYAPKFAHFFPSRDSTDVHEVTIDDHSNILSETLGKLREMDGTDERPIIFVAHSLGGLVCANALVNKRADEKGIKMQTKLIENTLGMLFLATPFVDEDEDGWTDVMQRIFDYVAITEADKTSRLSGQPKKAIEIVDAFEMLIARYPSIDASFFCEELPLIKDGRPPRIIVEADFAVLDGRTGISIKADHISICKYEGKDSAGYGDMSKELRMLLNKIEADVGWMKRIDSGDGLYSSRLDEYTEARPYYSSSLEEL